MSLKETLRKLIVVLLWTAVAYCIWFVLFGLGDDVTGYQKAWYCIIIAGGGWIVNKVINWILGPPFLI